MAFSVGEGLYDGHLMCIQITTKLGRVINDVREVPTNCYAAQGTKILLLVGYPQGWRVSKEVILK